MKYIKTFLVMFMVASLFPSISFAADTNTISSTVVTDKTPPTASAPSVVINNNDVCKSAYTGAVQTGFVGMSSGITVLDENCERIKLARSLFGFGMKVAAVSILCQDARIFDAMIMAGTPCPYKGKIGQEALKEWQKNPNDIPKEAKMVVSQNIKVKDTDTELDWFEDEGND